jgi:alanine dehydrogenase
MENTRRHPPDRWESGERSSPLKFLSNQQVEQSLDWASLVSALDDAFAALHSDPDAFTTPQRLLIERPSGTYLTMPSVNAEGWFGVKQVTVMPENRERGLPTVQAIYTLFDQTGSPALAAEATTFTYLRTAAVSAVAARRLAPQDATTLLVIGTGGLAPWMAEAHAQVRPYRRLLVWGRRAEGVAEVIKRLHSRRDRLPDGIEIEPVDDLQAAVAKADVVTLATTSSSPIIHGEWLPPAQHLDAVGAFTPAMAEVAPSVVKAAEVWVDDVASARAKAGDLLNAERHGWSFESLNGDLPKLVSIGGRTGSSGVTLFKSVGTAVSDLVFARLLYRSH